MRSIHLLALEREETYKELMAIPANNYGAFCDYNPAHLDGAPDGPLAGLRFGVKDLYDLAGFRTGAGNPDWLATHPPAQKTASAVQRLLDAGATVAGKTLTDELAYSLNGENAHYGTPVNPVSPERIPGGSSCGSAVAVAAGLVDFALGTDTAGSVRLPASFCGIAGFRPTHGVVPIDGVVPLAPSYDTVGWLAPNAEMLARVGDVLLPKDDAGKSFAPATLIIPADAWDLASPEVRSALEPLLQAIAASFAKTQRLQLARDGFLHWQQVFRVIQGHEVWQTHGAWITATSPRFGPGIRERFQWASTISAEDAEAAKPKRAAIANYIHGLLADAVMALPTVSFLPPRKGSPTAEEDRTRALCLLSIASLAGVPQVSLPLARAAGCAVGLSLIGSRCYDRGLLQLASKLMRYGRST
jgi:amidase